MIKFDNWKLARYRFVEYFTNTANHAVFKAEETGPHNQKRLVVVHRLSPARLHFLAASFRRPLTREGRM